MSFSCDFDSDGYEQIEVDRIAVESGKCCECGCEIAPGHEELVVMILDSHEDGPFDDLDERQQDEVLDGAYTFRHCTRCGSLAQSLWAAGICTEFGSLWPDYIEWLNDRDIAPRSEPIKYRPNRNRW
jgi:hypothetical protein